MLPRSESLPRRFGGALRLMVDFVVVILIGLLWIPLHFSQRAGVCDVCDAEEISEQAKRERGDGEPVKR